MDIRQHDLPHPYDGEETHGTGYAPMLAFLVVCASVLFFATMMAIGFVTFINWLWN